jgi:ketopantoate reductase
MRMAVVGAGAVGGYYGVPLDDGRAGRGLSQRVRLDVSGQNESRKNPSRLVRVFRMESARMPIAINSRRLEIYIRSDRGWRSIAAQTAGSDPHRDQ